MKVASAEFREWINEGGTNAQIATLNTALRTPRGLRNANLRNRKGSRGNKPLSRATTVTLDARTHEWLNQQAMSPGMSGSKSAIVEIALARSKLWFSLLSFCQELIDELGVQK